MAEAMGPVGIVTYQGYGLTLWVRVSDVWCARNGHCARFGGRPTSIFPGPHEAW